MSQAEISVSDHAKEVFRQANDAAYQNGYVRPMSITLRIADIRKIHAMLSTEITRLRAANVEVTDMGLKAAQAWAQKEMHLRASNVELVAALEPFARHAELIEKEFSDHSDDTIAAGFAESPITFADFRRARAAIATAKAEPNLEPQNYKIQPPTFVPKG